MAAPSRPQVPAIFSHVRCHVYASPPPTIRAAEDVHRSRAEAPEEDEGEAVRAVLDEIAHIFEGGEGEGDCYCRSLDFIALRLEHQKIEHQRQQLHHFLHHRRDLRRGGKGVRLTYRREEGVDIGRKQAHPHPGNAEQEEAKLPPAHAQSGHQQREIPCRGRCFRCRSCVHRLSRGGQQPQNRKRQQQIAPEGGACQRGIRPEAARRPEQIFRERKAQHADMEIPHIPRRARLRFRIGKPANGAEGEP